MATVPPLSTLLSQVLVAFTIELDNEFERQMAGPGPQAWFKVSLVMWSNFLRFVDADGVTVGELAARSGVSTKPVHPSQAGMERWGYVLVAPDPADPRPKPPRRDWIVRPTAAGLRAQRVWPPLLAVVEERWRARYGEREIERLREALRVLVARLDVRLPQYLPVVAQAMFVALSAPEADDGGDESELPLSALLAQVLLAFTMEYESDSELSLTMSANTLRVLDDEVGVRDLPRLTGVSKEAVSMTLTFLDKHGYLVVESDPGAPRIKVVRITAKGRAAQVAHRELLEVVEERWRVRAGDEVRSLRESLEALVGQPDLEHSRLAGALVPDPAGWRASVPPLEVLAHHPMVLHRGGWPDGS